MVGDVEISLRDGGGTRLMRTEKKSIAHAVLNTVKYNMLDDVRVREAS